MPDYSFAILSTVMWASSAPIINVGLNRIRKENFVEEVIIGLFLALLSGLIALAPIVYVLVGEFPLNSSLGLSGVLTFPVATGTYYLSGIAFGQRADFASQFSKVKPLLSILLAFFVLKEAMGLHTFFSMALVIAGVSCLVAGAGFRRIRLKGVLLGLSTAAFWALGELFMTVGLNGANPLAANFSCLVAGAVAFSPLFIVTLAKHSGGYETARRLWPFCVHGVLSFGLGYTFFFFSIQRVGLGSSVLINAFWPVLGVLLTGVVRKISGQPHEIPLTVGLAATLLLAASAIQALSYM